MPITLIAVSKATLLKAQERILGCEECSVEAEIPFDWVLDDVTGYDGAEVDYLLSEVARCPRCLVEVMEKTLVEANSLLLYSGSISNPVNRRTLPFSNCNT